MVPAPAEAAAAPKADAAAAAPKAAAAAGGAAAAAGKPAAPAPFGGATAGGGAAAAPPAASSGSRAAVTGSWPCKGGELVRVVQQGPGAGEECHQVQIVFDTSLMVGSKGVPAGSQVELHWGVYRSSPHLWQHPAQVVPPGSTKDERSGAMKTAMLAAADGASWHVTLSVPASLAPLTLAFVVRVQPPKGGGSSNTSKVVRPHFVTPLRGRHFSALVGCTSGSGARQGAALLAPPPPPQQHDQSPVPAAGQQQQAAGTEGAGGEERREVRKMGRAVVDIAAGVTGERHRPVSFAVRCRGVDRVCLVLVRPSEEAGQEWTMLELVLDPVLNRTGELWHIAVEGLHSLEGLCYGWRVEGDVSWETGSRIQPYQLLLDPHCPSLRYFPAASATDACPIPLPSVELPDGTQVAALSSLEGLAAELAWQQSIDEQLAARQQAAATQEQPAAGQQAAAAAQEQMTAGQQRFVAGPGLALEELRLMELDVRTFAQGKGVQHPGTYLGVAERVSHIKAVGTNSVILTPSYATAKGIGLLSRAAVHFMAADPSLAAGSTSSSSSSSTAAAEFRSMVSQLHAAGIEVMMMVELTFTAEGTDERPTPLSLRGLDYASYYRTNGVLNCGDPCAREYLLSVLRHWAREGVDGFCFINAENLVQDCEGTVLDAPPLADAMCHDPVLRPLKLVALPSNDSLLPRGGVRGFPHWGLWQQRNTGFGADLVAYLAEGTPGLLTRVAGRLMGSAAVFDSDWGVGFPGDLAIGRRPAFGMNSITVLGRQSLAELAAEAAELAVAAGAAEAAYGLAPEGLPPTGATVAKSLLALAVLSLGVPIVTQDAVADLAMAHFVGVVIRLRRRLARLLLPPLFTSPRDIRWHSAVDALVPPIWAADLASDAAAAGQRSTNYLAFSVRGPEGQWVYVGINPHPHGVLASLPTPPPGRVWERIVDTCLEAPDDAYLEGGTPIRSSTYYVNSKAVVVLQTAVLETTDVGLPPAALHA